MKRMLQHIALTVNDSEEIEKFYEKVFQFKKKHHHTIDGEVIKQIFNITGATEVYIMVHQHVQFEIFISPLKEKKAFSHVCLAFRNAEDIYRNALNQNYKVIVKSNPKSNTYFIWDKSGNMFEIKTV
jgi:catechol 2,3-dioxygenase-like lactoylglutathione lyase family enzyme